MRYLEPTVSPRFGLAAGLRLWRLVLAVWIVPVFLAMPVLMMVRGSFGRALAAAPETAAGRADVPLVVMQGLHRIGPALGAGVLGLIIGLWAWTVLWHAGTVGWEVWARGRPVRLGEIVGHGLLGWWRYARLSLAALAGLAVLAGVLCGPLLAAALAARRSMAEVRMMNLQLAAVVLGGVVLWICWSATLRGAWELAVPGRRSAALAWVRGLAGTFRQPVRSLGTVFLWATAGKVLTLAPVVFALRLPALRGAPGAALGLVFGLVAAFCWVALFLSFAPVSGMIPEPAGEDEEMARVAGPAVSSA